MKARRRFSTEFKAKVALEAIQRHRTISDLAIKHQLHPNQITTFPGLLSKPDPMIAEQAGPANHDI